MEFMEALASLPVDWSVWMQILFKFPKGATTPSTKYSLVAYANTIAGNSPSSLPYSLTTPISQPTLTSVQAISPTSGTATAIPPPGETYTKYTFTATPSGGGSPIILTSNSATAAIPGLTPGTQARLHTELAGLAAYLGCLTDYTNHGCHILLEHCCSTK